MAPVVIDLKKADDDRDVVHRAVQTLAEGRLVVFPTETVYGVAASALDAQAVQQILRAKNRDIGKGLALAVKSGDDALDYVPDLSPVAQRLARRCWPGPLTLVVKDRHPDGAIRQLAPPVQEAVCPHGTVGLRVPAHSIISSVLRLTPGALVLTSANRSGGNDPADASEVARDFGDQVALIVDDGRCRYGQPSTVVRVDENRIDILREGVFNRASIRQLSCWMALLVCTGNTCRSPMAEVLMRRMLAKQLGCEEDELLEKGACVMSAGIAAMEGCPASREAVLVMSEQGLELAEHASQPVTDRIVRFADLILTMTRGHREALLTQWPDARRRTSLLSHEARDISDPIGGPPEMYQRCAEQIRASLVEWLQQLPFDELLPVLSNEA